MAVFVADCIITVSTILKFNKRLRLLEDLQQQLDKLSVGIGENIYKNTTEAIEVSGQIKEDFEKRKEEFSTNLDERKQELEEKREELTQKKREELLQKYQEVLQQRTILQSRLLKAFPNMKSKTFKDSLEKLKDAKGIFPRMNFPRK